MLNIVAIVAQLALDTTWTRFMATCLIFVLVTVVVLAVPLPADTADKRWIPLTVTLVLFIVYLIWFLSRLT